MEALFSFLTHAVKGSAFIALSASFLWGMLSILLSPCHLSSIPLIVGFIDTQGKTRPARAFMISFSFSLGILITIALIGVVTATAGRMAGDIGPWGTYGVALIFFLIGLYLLDVIPAFWINPVHAGIRKKGLAAAFLLGLVFGIALGPCTFAYMAPMLAVTFNVAATHLVYGILLLFFYGVGHCSVIVFAGTFTSAVQNYLDWNERSKGAVIVKKICGVLVLLGGLYMLYIAP